MIGKRRLNSVSLPRLSSVLPSLLVDVNTEADCINISASACRISRVGDGLVLLNSGCWCLVLRFGGAIVANGMRTL